MRLCTLLVALTVLAAGCGSTNPNQQQAGATTGGAVSVQITAPADGETVRADRVAIRGTVSPPDAEVRVVGEPAQVGNGVFSASVPLHRGNNSVDVVASAPGASPATTTITIRRPSPVARSRKPSSRPNTPSSPAPSSSGGSVAPSLISASNCGSGVQSGANTSCAFALNVRDSYNRSGGSSVLQVYSPVTGQTYTMYCTTQSPHICTGGNNASVYFGDAGGYSTRDCGGGLLAGANTSCPFAVNVRSGYQSSGAGVLSVYSPTTNRTYTMYCTAVSPHVCTGGNNASVYFP